MEDIKKNHHSKTEIEEEFKHVNRDIFFDFDSIGIYEFARGEDCDGPLLAIFWSNVLVRKVEDMAVKQ